MTKSLELSELIADAREQVLYLQELGVEALDATIGERRMEFVAKPVEPEVQRYAPPPAIPNIRIEPPKPIEMKPEGRLTLSDLPSLGKRPKSVTSAPGWDSPRTPDLQQNMSDISAAAEKRSAVETVPVVSEPTETIEIIRADIGNCTRCPLNETRNKIVHSTGNFNADLMFVGEAPGADEDEQGLPFVGRAGQLLTKIIEGIGLRREDVFIGNINRCRPPENRAPAPAESAMCKPFLFREIAVVRPKVIVVLGATAAQNLLETKVPIGKLRGMFHDYRGTKVMPTFHPAYLLRDPHKKREVWEDMKMVRDYLNKNI